MSLAGPKARPNGVVDGSLVDNPEPGTYVDHVGTRLKFQSRRWLSVFRGEPMETGKSVSNKWVPTDEWNLRGKRSRDGDRCKKLRGSLYLTVPQTDTGRQVEDTKAFEITIVKELGKLTP